MENLVLQVKSLENEIWKVIPENENYWVSNMGRVMSTHKNKARILTPRKYTRGYARISMRLAGKKVDRYVHRLICAAFMPGVSKGKEVNHKNGVKNDNKLENLEWCTPKQNRAHAETLSNVIEGHKKQGRALAETWRRKKEITG